MIDISEKDIAAVRQTADGERFVVFTRTDLLPHWGQGFWGVMLDTGSDGLGVPVRYGTLCTAPAGWSLRQLLLVLQARMALDHARAPEGGALTVLEALGEASRQMQAGEPLGAGVEYGPSGRASPYAWTLAWCGDLALPLCPDPASREEGVVPEQVLLVLAEALRDWAERAPYLRRVWQARNAVQAALAAEIVRVRIARGGGAEPSLPG